MLFCHSEDVISMMHGNQNIQNKKLKLNILPISFLPSYLFSSPSIGTDPIDSFRHRSHFISHAKIYEKKEQIELDGDIVANDKIENLLVIFCCCHLAWTWSQKNSFSCAG